VTARFIGRNQVEEGNRATTLKVRRLYPTFMRLRRDWSWNANRQSCDVADCM